MYASSTMTMPWNDSMTFTISSRQSELPVGLLGEQIHTIFVRSSHAASRLVGMHLEVVVQQDATVLHVVDVGTHLIHAVCRLDGHHVVTARLAEDAVSQVDGLVAAVAQEYHVLGHALHLLQQLLRLALQRVGVAVVGSCKDSRWHRGRREPPCQNIHHGHCCKEPGSRCSCGPVVLN